MVAIHVASYYVVTRCILAWPKAAMQHCIRNSVAQSYRMGDRVEVLIYYSIWNFL